MQDASGSENLRLLEQRFDALGGALEELKAMVKDIGGQVAALEKREISCNLATQMRVEQAHQRLEEQAKAMKAMDERQDRHEMMMQRLYTAYGILVFVASAFGVSLVALLWSLMTGQATVVFK